MDAHCHTDCSDGNITIEDRIAMIRDLGYEAATITDHDFISAEQVRRARTAAGDLPYIPAAEFSGAYKKQIVHVLGYFIDENRRELQQHMDKVDAKDRGITERMLLRFHEHGAKFEIQDLVSDSLHTFYSMQFVKRIAVDLYENDPQRTMDAFMKVLGDLGLTYADFTPWPVKDLIEVIHKAGGIAVLAHPGGKNDKAMRELGFYLHDDETIKQYIDWGLDGVETRTPVHSADEVVFYEGIAKRYGLLMTAGSDCHGDDDYLGPALMGKFDDLFEDGYERIFEKWKERTG